ncbi:testicular acid phosphatase homolog isoform X5 [Parasteatoda tepidariorum]|uniref:testicular acid phosphatase homolog isoform X5 n=1 Tax=Parasteatoda tepidariorum TaxID=114398 RepID=UPI001C71AAF9|nr:testicular acid phosphatase homolog isoform X2 [Parasteatoda tepidariorum]
MLNVSSSVSCSFISVISELFYLRSCWIDRLEIYFVFEFMMIIRWTFFVLLIVLMTQEDAADKECKELLLVQVLFRHGDRAPLRLYPTDPNPVSIWPGGLGALTKLGKLQLYVLGQQLRYMYRDFLTTNPIEINVNSSEYDRCLESTESFLASFYAPTDEFKFSRNVDWQPLPVHSVPKEIDKDLDTGSFCPTTDAEEKRIINSPDGQAYIAKHKEMFDYLTFYSGTPITDWITAYYLFDTLFVENKYNLTIPVWAHKYWDELQEVYDESYYWWYKSYLMKRLRGGPLMKKLIEIMNEKIDGKLPDLKFQIFSTHDDNLALLLEIFDIFPLKLPPYASTLLFELYRGTDNANFVRLLYLNSTEPELGNQTPHILKLHGCEEYCPLEFFTKSAQPFFPVNWEEECGITR